MTSNENSRIESEAEVRAYIQNLKYALNSGAEIVFQEQRRVDDNRDVKYTNRYTVGFLFPNEKPTDAIKRELLKLNIDNYMRTIRDIRFPTKSEMREFGKNYQSGDVYIKIRVDVLGMYGNSTTFVMSFHFAERPFAEEMFPYRRK